MSVFKLKSVSMEALQDAMSKALSETCGTELRVSIGSLVFERGFTPSASVAIRVDVPSKGLFGAETDGDDVPL